MERGGQRHTLAALLPGKTQYTLYRRLGGSYSQSRQVWKIFPVLAFDPQTVQPVGSAILTMLSRLLYIYLYLCAYTHFGIFWHPAVTLGSNHNTSVSYCFSVCAMYLQARNKVMGERKI